MRKPKTSTPAGGAEAPPPTGGRALGRAAQFTYSRGLSPPVVDTPVTLKKPKPAAPKPAAKKAAKKRP